MLGIFSLETWAAGAWRPERDALRRASRDLGLWVAMSWPKALLVLKVGL